MQSRSPDPNMASLAYNFGRYVLIGSSRPGTQPANLQGIWERGYESDVGLKIHYQYQYTNELLAC
jgi:hypothetical protein